MKTHVALALFAALLAALCATPASAAEGLTFYVAVDGNDAWSGRLASANAAKTDGPLASLQGARDAIRKLKKASGVPRGGLAVEVAAGRYQLAQPLELAAEDSGADDAPIVYRARQGAEVRLLGGREVTGWKPVAAPDELARLDPAARGKTFVADLKAQGITDFGEVKAGHTWAQSDPGLELFFADEPTTLARWPNEGFTKIPSVLGPTPVDIRGTKGCKEGIFSYEGDRPARWRGQPDVMLHGYWFWDWADQRLKVESIDAEKHSITLAAKPQHHYGFRKGQWYYAYNVLCELDRPGEWWLDRAQGKLYFWPPTAIEKSRAVVSSLPAALIAKKAECLTFQGFTIEGTRGTAVQVSQGRRVRLLGCTIRNTGNAAASLNGRECGAIGCDIAQTAGGGVSIDGGDRKTLTPGRMFVENCHIRNFGRWNPVYKPAVSLSGVGNRMAHNLIHDAPHMAVSFSGNDHVIEYNEIHSVVYESNDAGVMYAGYNPTMRGHEIRHNYIHHVYGYQSRGCVGVYLDDMFCSAHIAGNVFYKVPRAAFIGGGRDSLVENNLFVDCKPALHIDARALGWAAAGVETLKKRLAEMPYEQEPWRSRFPQLLKYLDDEPAVPKGNVVRRNVCWGGRWDEIEKKAQPHVRLEENLVDVDPRIVNFEKGDFRLQADSPAWKLGFQAIPVEKIGLYASPDRASWPVRHTVRPQPEPQSLGRPR